MNNFDILAVIFEVPGHLVLSLYDLCVYDINADRIPTPYCNDKEINFCERRQKWKVD